MYNKALVAVLLLCLVVFIPSCGKKNTNKPAVQGKTMTAPEVVFKLGVDPKGYTLPKVPEISWNFYEDSKGTDLICKLKMKVHFTATLKCHANVNLLDLNNFPVTSQQIKLDGLAGEETSYEVIIYISPDMSKRITKARIEIEPI